jgi:nitrate reductase NapE component
MNDLLNLLKGIAPTVATMVAGPLGGAAVSALASKFGVSDSVEAVAKAIAGDPAAAQKLAEMELEYAKLDAAYRDSARKNEAALATNENVPILNKSVTPILALVIVGAWGFIQYHLLTHIVPDVMREIIIRVLGTLDGALVMVLSYYFGASHKH